MPVQWKVVGSVFKNILRSQGKLSCSRYAFNRVCRLDKQMSRRNLASRHAPRDARGVCSSGDGLDGLGGRRSFLFKESMSRFPFAESHTA